MPLSKRRGSDIEVGANPVVSQSALHPGGRGHCRDLIGQVPTCSIWHEVGWPQPDIGGEGGTGFSVLAPTSQSCLVHQPFAATARGIDALAVMATRQAVARPTMGALR
jgi:hypothetical protein